MKYWMIPLLLVWLNGPMAHASIPSSSGQMIQIVTDWEEVEIPACYIDATALQVYWTGVLQGREMAEYLYISTGICHRTRVRVDRGFLFGCQKEDSFDCGNFLIWTPTGWLYGVMWPK